MQTETEIERQDTYPVLRAMFVRETGHPNPQITHEVVRLVQTAKYGFVIEVSTAYDHSDSKMIQESKSEVITCKYPPTAKWIYDNCRDLARVTNDGAIVKDIPFDC